MFVHNIDPVLLELGPFEIRYYGLVYVIGFLLAYYFLYKAADSERIDGWSVEAADELMMWEIIGGVVGGRLGYFLFYNIEYFWQAPLEILKIWQGGMSFHGGLLGVIIATYWFTRNHEYSFMKIADVLTLPAAFSLGLGRIANFINGEIVGTKTGVPWCFEFPGFDGCRHPVQFYLAGKNFLLAGLLWFLDRRDRKTGFLFWNFIFWYGVGRFVIDFWRADPTFLGISMGQYLSLAMVLIGGWVLWQER